MARQLYQLAAVQEAFAARIEHKVQERRDQTLNRAEDVPLLGRLPDTWVVFHSVVVEPRPDDFAQIDLLLIGPAGMFLVEAKAWRGSYKAYRDTWHQREGNTWVP